MNTSILPRWQCELSDGRVATFRELGPDDYERIIALRNEVISTLPDPDLYVREDDERSFVMSHLGRQGVTLGIELEGRLVGYSALTIDIEEAGLEPEFAAAIREHAAAVHQPIHDYALLAVTMIHPSFRGGPLHPAAISGRLRIAMDRGRNRVMAMVPAANVASLRNLTRWGLRVVGLVEFRDGRVRLLLGGPVQANEVEWEGPSRYAVVSDITTHRGLTADGYLGHEVVVNRGLTFVRYSKPQ